MIYIITHKQCKMPVIPGYVPLLVGAFDKDCKEYLRDDSGDNISYKNRDYCELTGLYWIWKNTEDDCPYRKFAKVSSEIRYYSYIF